VQALAHRSADATHATRHVRNLLSHLSSPG
jgi:hypothetical protein